MQDLYKVISSIYLNETLHQLLEKVSVVLCLALIKVIVQNEFKCPCEEDLKTLIVCLWFFGPFIILSIFTALLKLKSWMVCSYSCNCKNWTSVIKVFQVLYPGLCWCFFLLIDGGFFTCCFVDECENGKKKNTTTQDIAKYTAISQSIGFVSFIFLLIIYLVLHFCCYKKPEIPHKDLYLADLETKAEEALEKFRHDLVKQKIGEFQKSLYRSVDTTASESNTVRMNVMTHDTADCGSEELGEARQDIRINEIKVCLPQYKSEPVWDAEHGLTWGDIIEQKNKFVETEKNNRGKQKGKLRQLWRFLMRKIKANEETNEGTPLITKEYDHNN